jgi:hypothetical protein
VTAVLLPLADHGGIIAAIPFVVPMVVLVSWLLYLALRERLRR